MKRLFAPLAILLLALPAFGAAERYIVATRRAPLSDVSMLRDERETIRRGVRTFSIINAFAADLTPDEAAELRRSSGVRYVEPVVERHCDSTGAPAPALSGVEGPALSGVEGTLPAVPRAGSPTLHSSSFAQKQTTPYGIDLVRAPAVWHFSIGGGEVHVAILDTGIDYHHPDLRSNYAGGYNTFNLTTDPLDDNRHGTHVAGTIAAADNGLGVVGVAPGVKIWAVKVLDSTGFGSSEHIIAGVDWVVQKKRATGGNWIMSLSLGSTTPSDAEREAFVRAIDNGILVVAAVGNRGFPDIDYPAAYDGVIAVGAVDAQQNIVSFSNWGPRLDLVAPGVSILSTVPVGSVAAGEVQVGSDNAFHGSAIAGSPKGEVLAPFVFCGLGRPEEIPRNASGKIAVIRRGELSFNEKTRNARAAGAIGVVIINRNDDTEDMLRWTLILNECGSSGCQPSQSDLQYQWPVTVAIGFSDGERLLGGSPGATIVIRSVDDDYARLSGTSMATPHVSGVAALAWSLAPNASAAEVRDALEQTAHDLGDFGVDIQFGHGLVDAVASVRRLAPELLPPRRRATGR